MIDGIKNGLAQLIVNGLSLIGLIFIKTFKYLYRMIFNEKNGIFKFLIKLGIIILIGYLLFGGFLSRFIF